MTTPRRPFRAAFTATAVALTATLLVTTAGTPIAGGQSSGSLDTESLSPGGGGSGSLGSAGSSGRDGDAELVGPDAPPLRDIEHSIIPRDTTEIADPGTVMSVTGEMGQPQSTVITPDQDDLPEVGEYFVVDVGPGSPSGVVGRVIGVTTLPSGLIQITTEPAGIEEAYEEFSINTTVDFDDAVATDGGSEVGPMGRMQARSGGGLTARPSISWLQCENGGTPVSFDAEASLLDMSGTVAFDPKTKYLRIVITYTHTFGFSVGLTGGVKCKVPQSKMPSHLVPLAGPFGLKASPTLEFEASAGGRLTTEVKATRSDGIEIADRVRGITRSDFSSKEIEGDASIDAKLFAGLKAEVAASIRIGEATAGISAGPELSASRDARNCLALGASFRVAATVSASALWMFEWSTSVTIARIGFLLLINDCGITGSTTTRPTGTSTTSPTTTTSTPPPGFRDGAITNLVVGAGLNCDVQSPTDGRSVYYGPGACATIAHVDGQSYGASVPASGAFNRSWTPVSQSITGSATAADPMVVRTTVRAGDTGVELSQVDYFVDGNPGYQTDITVRNTSGAAKDVKIYRAADCYLGRSDYGTGSVYSRSVSCNDSSGRRIALTDLTGGALRQEASFSRIWDIARAGGDYDDTVETASVDNGMGINWNRSIPAGGSTVLRSRFQLDEPVQQANARGAARMAPLDVGPDVKVARPAEESRPLPTTVPTSVPTS